MATVAAVAVVVAGKSPPASDDNERRPLGPAFLSPRSYSIRGTSRSLNSDQFPNTSGLEKVDDVHSPSRAILEHS